MMSLAYIGIVVLLLSAAFQQQQQGGVIIVSALKEPATGISFADTKNGLTLMGVGVRKKGPFKIYAVACYGETGFKESLHELSRSRNKNKAYNMLRIGAKDHHTCFVLEMSFKVGAEKMATAIAESVAPRHTGNLAEVNELKSLIFAGVNAKGGKAIKGTTFEFDCDKDGITVMVDGQMQGRVDSADLSQAFCDVYLDGNGVSPPLRDSCLENCCAD